MRDILLNRVQRLLRLSQIPAADFSENRDGFPNIGERVGGTLLLLPNLRHEMARDARRMPFTRTSAVRAVLGSDGQALSPSQSIPA